MRIADQNEQPDSLVAEPIGYVRSSMHLNFEAPHQPTHKPWAGGTERSFIELISGKQFELAVQDLEGFEKIWILWWANRNRRWRPFVLPPRGRAQRRGVFATRSPHRPNPICLTSVDLISVNGLVLEIGNSDLLHGTPILDIKPYIPSVDAFPEADGGWVSELEQELLQPPQFSVVCTPLVSEQLSWLATEWGIDILTRAREILERDPHPHRSRRIGRYGPKLFRMGCGPWRLIFSLKDAIVSIEAVTRGFPERALMSEQYTRIPDREAQIAFGARWTAPQRNC